MKKYYPGWFQKLRYPSLMVLAVVVSLLTGGTNVLLAQKIGLTPDKKIQQFTLDQWSSNQGLPYTVVNHVIQSRDGYLWLSTFGGLVRFDGVRFEIYNKKKSSLFRTNGIYNVSEDAHGKIWLGTQGSGLLYYDKGHVVAAPVEQEFFKPISAIFALDSTRVWLGTIGSGVFLYEKSATVGKIIPVAHPSVRDITIRSIKQDKLDRTWFGTEGKGVTCFDKGNFKTFTTANGLPNDKAPIVYPARNGTVWVGTTSGLARIENNTVSAVPEIQGYHISSILEDEYHNLWVGTDRGLFRKNGKTGQYEYFSEAEGLPNKSITSLCFDREGSLWMGTSAAGLVRIKDGKFINYSFLDGIASRPVNFICEITPQKFYVATDAGIVNVIENGEVSTLPLKTSLGDVPIRHIMKDRAGNTWISSAMGLLKVSGSEEKLYTTKDGLPEERVRLSFEDSRGNVWIGFREGGLVKLLPDGTMEYLNKSKGLGSNFIMSIQEDTHGNLLVGTNNGGLNIIKPDGKIEIYTSKHGLAGTIIFNTYTDEQDITWITTNAGLCKFSNGKFTVFNSQHGLPSDAPFDVLEDNTGYFWLSSSEGIFRVSRKALDALEAGKIKTVSCAIYGRDDGMRAKEAAPSEKSLRASDGRLWFTTLDGVSVIDPRSIAVNPHKPPVYITGLITDHEEVDLAHFPIEVAPGKKRFVFEFTGLSFTVPAKVNFRYKLDNFDKEWIEAGAVREAVYTNLPPGDYVFRVMAANNDGVWNEHGAQFAFRLRPHFYQTNIFYLLVFSSFIFSFWGVYRWRLEAMKREKRKLEKLVEERTAEIREQNRALEEQKQEILVQNEELEQQAEEILAQRDYIEEKNQELEEQKDEILAKNSELEQQKEEIEAQRDKLVSAKMLIERKNNSITDSIRYAKTIQKSILPDREVMNRGLKLENHFVIFRPKDIVSGDFFWYKEIENRIYLAVVDCTGHGVPGAFMSLIGNMLLNETVNELSQPDPATVLEVLHISIRKALRQADRKNDDGMDIALCMIEKGETTKVTFAGAKRPLYHVSGSTIHEVRGDRKSIGGRQKEERHVFTNCEFSVQPGDAIYLASDGFVDQNGKDGEKYGTQRFKEALLKVSTLDMKTQKDQLLAMLKEHQGNTEQRDDITMVGVKF